MKGLRQLFINRRLALAMTQTALASAAGLTQKTVSDFETAKASTTAVNLDRMLRVLGLELTAREASPRPTLDELSDRYPEDEKETPSSRARPRRP